MVKIQITLEKLADKGLGYTVAQSIRNFNSLGDAVKVNLAPYAKKSLTLEVIGRVTDGRLTNLLDNYQKKYGFEYNINGR